MSMMAPQGPPPAELAALLGGAQDQGAPQGADPLQALQDAIHSVAAAMSALPDPQDTQDAAQALLVLSKVQTRLMGSAGGQPPGR